MKPTFHLYWSRKIDLVDEDHESENEESESSADESEDEDQELKMVELQSFPSGV